MMTTKILPSQIALAHDSLTQYGGAERVFEAVHEMFPESDAYTLVKDSGMDSHLSGWKIITSPLQGLYSLYPHYTHLFALIPIVLKIWKPIPVKILLTSSSSFIKALIKPEGAIHIDYCHTPTRFLWMDPEHAYQEIPAVLHPLAKAYFSWMKKWDLRAAKNVDFFIANSKEVQKRIKNIYKRESEIIYPFVNTDFWEPTQSKQDYFLIAGRLQYAKGLKTVIEVFNDLGLPLHVVGTGRFERQLKSMAKGNIKFLGRASDEVLRDEYSGARGFIYPQFEDFGIMPLEAAGCGTATIGLAKGGSLETIIPNQTGELLEIINAQTLKTAVLNWDETNYSQETLIQHSKQFNKENFQQKLLAFVESKIA
jgi:glycosyltransferase involved in cell wall biosynthesis